MSAAGRADYAAAVAALGRADRGGGTSGPPRARAAAAPALVLVLGVLVGVAFHRSTQSSTALTSPAWVADLLLGALACGALVVRERHALALALALAPVTLASDTSSIAVLVAVYAVGATRSAALVGLAVAAHVLAVLVGTGTGAPAPDPWWVSALYATAFLTAAGLLGMYVGARRALLASLQDRAERAERLQRLEAERARVAERTRIAREMHDVLAHRVSLISLHAGGMQLRPDAPEEDIARGAELIQTTARLAMDDLRGVIGVLRSDGASATGAPQAPQPRLGDIGALVDASRAAGLPVELAFRAPEADRAPAALGRDAYRIVQEALTNVHKHAAAAPTRVRLDGAPGAGLRIEVRNELPDGPQDDALPGAGAGLLGLAERVALAHGELTHGRRGREFVVAATLGWPA